MQIDLRHGDCVEVMKTLADASVDAVVTDPPYELGFMGKGWDASGIAYNVAMWREVLRVLKPGGHLLAFGGTRTYHRMAVAIEDAGFEIRDSLHWIYGCLSEDTEILVNGEWVHYSKAIEGSLALCYDVEHEAYAWRSIERLYVYAYDDTAYRIESGATDQIVSRNHRCLVEREGKWKFVVAEELAREQEARVPVLEALPAMLNAIRVQQSNTSGSEHALREVSDGAAEIPAPEGSDEDQKGRLCGVRDGDGKTGGVAQTGEAADMLAQVQRGGSWRRIGETRTQGACCVDGCKPGIIPTKDDRSGESSVEGRGDVQAEQGELRRAKVCPVSTGVSDDGAQGRLRHGASVGGGDGLGPMSCACGGGSPRRSRHEEQRAVEPHAVRVESGAQVVRGEGFTGTTLARVTPIHYVGKVWCVKVPTGAFVARRNGKVFVTGNSGFPKSLDVSKAIDKAAGAKRQVVGLNPNHRAVSGVGYEGVYAGGNTGAAVVTAPATDAAKQWSGWGTALKPAHEPVVVARKPIVGTVAANVQAHGTGALNIDECRVQYASAADMDAARVPQPAFNSPTGAVYGFKAGEGRSGDVFDPSKGRWPPNILLSHAPECMPVGTRKVKTGVAVKHRSGGKNIFSDVNKPASADQTYADADGTETVEAWDCAEGCPVAEMDRQSGTLKSGTISPHHARNVPRLGHGGTYGNDVGTTAPREWKGDSGGASRFFPVFRYQAKASRSERGVYLTCDCKAGSIPSWVNEVRKQQGQMGATLPPRGICAGNTEADCDCSTLSCGSKCTGQCRPDGKSTTSTKTNLIIDRKTSDLSRQSSTSGSTVDASFATEYGSSHAEFAESASRLMQSISTSQVKGGRCTGVAVPATSESLWRGKSCDDCGAQIKFESHATVKPVELMRWLVRLVTPPGGVVLEPFMGSGTTGVACVQEGFGFVGIEREAEYFEICKARIAAAQAESPAQKELFSA